MAPLALPCQSMALTRDMPAGQRRTDKREKRLGVQRSYSKYCNYNSVIEKERREERVLSVGLEEVVDYLFSMRRKSSQKTRNIFPEKVKNLPRNSGTVGARSGRHINRAGQ